MKHRSRGLEPPARGATFFFHPFPRVLSTPSPRAFCHTYQSPRRQKPRSSRRVLQHCAALSPLSPSAHNVPSSASSSSFFFHRAICILFGDRSIRAAASIGSLVFVGPGARASFFVPVGGLSAAVRNSCRGARRNEILGSCEGVAEKVSFYLILGGSVSAFQDNLFIIGKVRLIRFG